MTVSAVLPESAATDRKTTYERQPDGSLVVRNRAVLRTGTFVDSRGRKATYTKDDLQGIAKNFGKVKKHQPDLPVRANHSRGDVNGVQGYLENVKVDGDTLRADYTILEPDAADKVERKTWRSVSAEIGAYKTNSGEDIPRTLVGLAYVDLPAVEGLYSLQLEDETMELTEQELQAKIDEAVAEATKGTYSQEDLDWSIGAAYAQADVDLRAEYAKDDDEPFEFALTTGETTTNPAEVQAEIVNLGMRVTAAEGALSEQRDKQREFALDQLVKDQKITKPTADAWKDMVLEFSNEAFATWLAGYELAPTLGTSSSGAGDDNGNEQTELQAEVQQLEAQLSMHRASGVSEAELAEMPSFKRLAALKNKDQEV